MGRTSKSKLITLEPYAHEYYLTGKHEELLIAWEESSTSDKYKAPETVYFVARVYIFRGKYVTALNILEYANEGYKRQENGVGLARVALAQADIFYHESNLDLAIQYIQRSLTMTDDTKVWGEANLLWGEAMTLVDAKKAMQHYNEAWKLLKEASTQDRKYGYYAAQASLRLANIAFMRNDDAVAQTAQEHARLMLANMDDSLVSPLTVMQMANQMMQSGDFEKAWKYTSQIDLNKYESPTLDARIHTVKAYMAWLCNDDTVAWREITPVLKTALDNEHVKGLIRVAHTHLLLSQYDFEQALLVAEGGVALSSENPLLKSRFEVLIACILALSNQVDETTLATMEEMLTYFKENFFRMEILQALLVAAWVAKMLGNTEKTSLYLQELVKSCYRSGNVSHIHRYWQMAYPYISDEWDAVEGVEIINEALQNFEKRFIIGINLQKERLMGFGYPTLWRGKRKILRGEVRAKYLLYMIEADNQTASREEILELLWPDAPLNVAIRNFGTLRAEIKEQLAGGLPTYEEGRYTLPENFPTYYDVRAFQEAIDLSKRYDHPSYRLVYLMRAIDLYQNHFANGITGKFVYEKAKHYYYIVQLLIEDAIQLAEQTGRGALKERLAEKRQWLLDNPPVERFPR